MIGAIMPTVPGSDSIKRSDSIKHNASPPLPVVEFGSLDELWFQVAGTRCNLTCSHCFISCSPHNDSFGFLSLADVERRLLESVEWGVKEFYFTDRKSVV